MNQHPVHRGTLRQRQSGIALLAFSVLLAIVSVGLLVERLSTRSQDYTARERASNEVLARAKADLIAWSVSHPTEPGRLPWPDRNGDGNYDGGSDCVTTGFNNSHLIGRFPHAGDASPCDVVPFGSYAVDGFKEPLWYAVSRNLLWNRGQSGSDPPLNPDLLDGGAAYPWLTVRDESGNVLSNRVAAVIFAPGSVVGNQARSGAAPSTSQYLDNVTVGATNYDNSDSDLDFIIYPDSRKTTTDGDSFNDLLIYITIDELMQPLEKRVIGEVAVSMNAYRNASTGWTSPPPNPSFPWLRPFTDPKTAPNFHAVVGTREGLVPLHQPNESFSTAFNFDWSAIAGANIVTTGTVTAADLTDGPAGGVDVPQSADNCTWSDGPGPASSNRRSVVCSSVPVTRDNGCVIVFFIGLLCERQTFTFDLYYTTSAPASVTVSAPSSTDQRRRTVGHTGLLPVNPSASPMIQIVEELKLTNLFSGAIIFDWTTNGTGTLTTTLTTTGTVATTGLLYELDYVNGLELPEWFVTNLWHHYLYAAVSADDAPGGAGDCVTSGNCLSINVSASVIPNVQALVIAAGGEFSGPPLNQDRDSAASPDESDYFELQNADGVDAGNPAERGAFTASFNDQVRIVANWP